MKLSFLPGELILDQGEDGLFRVTVRGEELFRSRSQKAAVTKFNELRRELERRFPQKELTPDQKKQILMEMIGDELVGRNSLGGRKKKTTARSTRTFGG